MGTHPLTAKKALNAQKAEMAVSKILFKELDIACVLSPKRGELPDLNELYTVTADEQACHQSKFLSL